MRPTVESKGDHDEGEESDKSGAEGQEAEREQASQVYAPTRNAQHICCTQISRMWGERSSIDRDTGFPRETPSRLEGGEGSSPPTTARCGAGKSTCHAEGRSP